MDLERGRYSLGFPRLRRIYCLLSGVWTIRIIPGWRMATLRLSALRAATVVLRHGNRVKRFAALHFVMNDCDLRSISVDLRGFGGRGLCGGGLSSFRWPDVSPSVSSWRLLRRRGRSGDRQMQGQHSAPAKAVAAQAVPAANHVRRDAEIVGYGLHRVSAANLVAGDAPGVGRGVAGRMLARRDRNDQLAIRLRVRCQSRWLASAIALAVVR